MRPIHHRPPTTAPRRPSTRRQVLGVGLVCATALVAGLSGCKAPEAPEKLTIAEAGTVVMGLLYVAQAQGFFKEQGLDVTLQRHPSGRDAIAAVLAGQADVATPYDGPAVMNINRGNPVRILGSLGMSPGETVVLARKDRGINTVTDLRGKRIGIIANSNPEYVLSLLLKGAGMRPDDIVRVPLAPPETATALVEGRVDAIATWVPNWQIAQTQLGPQATVTFTSDSYLEFATLSTSAAVLQARPAALVKMLRALVQAENYAGQHPAETLKIIETALSGKFPPEVLQERWGNSQLQLRMDNRMQVSLQNQAAWFAQHAGIGQAPTDIRAFMADGPLRSVAPQNVTLRPLP